jgi:hypothetical protein
VPEKGTGTTFPDHWRRQGWLEGCTPVPLGEQRERFRALVRDMRQRGETYTSQLSMLTLAGLNRPNSSKEQPHSILANLLQGAAIKGQEEAELLLWQSRLILQLGEIFDGEQADLNSALATIAKRQDRLLAELCDGEENPFSIPVSIQDTCRETDTILRHRLKAWTRFCFHGDTTAPGLLITSHQTAMDLLQEVFEKIRGKSAQPLASL